MTTDDRARKGNGRRDRAEGPDALAAAPPPHNLTAEESLLGAAMLSRAALEVLVTDTRPGDFYKPAHALIADVMVRAFAEGWHPEPVTIAAELERLDLLDAVGGPGALVTIQSSTGSTTSAPRYARIVHEHATLRRLLGSAGEIADLARGPLDAHDAVSKALEVLDRVAATNGTRSSSTLDVADVGALLDSELEPEEADFLRRHDGKALFYAGKMHVLQAEPSSGKTWIVLLAALEVLRLGAAVLYLDFEDTAKGILGRLLALGADPADVRARFGYVQPSGGFGPTERVELERLLGRLNPDLIVIDGVAEALARDGYSEDKAAEVVAWIEKLPRWLARTGAAVVMLDHVVKDREQQGRWARGSGAKLGAVDGAAYLVKVSKPFSRHRDGILKLVIAKDRPGGVGAIGEVAAVAYVEPKADGARVVIRLERAPDETSIADTWKPTVLMRKVSDELERSSQPLTASALRSLIHSDKPRLVTEAISRLIVEGYIVEKKRGRSTILELARPYVEGGAPPGAPRPPDELFDDLAPDDAPDNVTRGPWPDPTPHIDPTEEF